MAPRPITHDDQIVVRVSAEQHDALRKIAAVEERTVAQIIRLLIRQRINGGAPS